MGVLVQNHAIQLAFKDRLEALGQTADVTRLRLALLGARAVAFDWTLADDRIRWDGTEAAIPEFSELERLETGQGFRAWLSLAARTRLLEIIEEPASYDSTFRMEFQAVTKTSRQWFELSAVCIPGPGGHSERITGMVREITENRNALTRLSYLATSDELTGHLNRARLRDELTRVIGRSTADGRSCAFIVTAIDKLAVINETYGFDAADEVIVAAGQRLAQALRTSDIIGRIAGNKFGVVLGECGEREMSLIAERLHTAVRSEPIPTRAGAISASVSVGAVWLPQGAATSQDVMLRAEEALERAKAMGRNGFAVYSGSAQRESQRRRLINIGDEIMSALGEQRLVLAYQPIVGARSRQPEHYECLLRMQRKDGTVAAAGEFIPAAETLGLVRHADRRALEIAVAQLYRHPHIKLSINVSGTTAGDHSWLQSFINYVRENREVAERMTVELTETAALQAFEENARFVTRLRDMGCRVAIDDFGAGYTSFRNLHNLRVDMVKIDGEYVKNLSGSPDNQLFVRTLVDLAKNFQLETVAEWVGSEQDAELLVDFGVDYFQGYYFGEPELSPAWLEPNERLAHSAFE
ncbi:MAG TPA: bifunctional diguanylate cyclase/phosphodiesterase [Micropepsaceae bacterium]